MSLKNLCILEIADATEGMLTVAMVARVVFIRDGLVKVLVSINLLLELIFGERHPTLYELWICHLTKQYIQISFVVKSDWLIIRIFSIQCTMYIIKLLHNTEEQYCVGQGRFCYSYFLNAKL